MKKKRFVWGVVALFFLSTFLIAGKRDRFSDIDLERSNYVSIPEISAPSGNPLSNRGWLYIKDNAGTSDLYFEDDAGTVTELTASAGGAVSLDTAYNQSPTIVVDSTAITLTMSHATNIGLDINKTAGSGNTIDIQNAGTGKDIDGTSSTWHITKAGVGTFLSFALENAATIDNAANGTVSITEGGEDLDILFTTNVIDFSTDTAATTWEMYDGAASVITKAADGAADDFTLSLTGAQDSSLVLASAGTGADALTITASAGGMDIVVSGSSAADDLDLNSDSSINIVATEDAASAVVVQANGGTSETIVILSSQGTGDDSVNIDSTAGGFDLDAALSINVTSAENTTDALVLEASAGGVQILASGAAATEDILVTATGSSIKLSATENAADSVTVTSTAGGIDITAAGAATEDIDIVNTAGSTHISGGEAIADAVTIAAGAGGIDITSAATFDIDVTATGGKIILAASEDAGGAINISADAGTSETVLISSVKGTGNGVSAGSIDIDSTVGGISMGANAAGMDININSVLGRVEIEAEENAASAIHIISDGGTSSGIILLNDTGTGDESILLDSDLGGITLDANAGSIDIEAVGASDGDIRIIAGDDLTITGTGIVAITGEILKQNERVTAANTITAAECGKTFFLDADAEFESILPAISTVSAGCYFKFIIADAAAGADYTVVTGNTLEDAIYGSVMVNSTHVACSAEDTITLDDGILEGDWVDFESDGTFWYINGSAPIAGDILCSAT